MRNQVIAPSWYIVPYFFLNEEHFVPYWIPYSVVFYEPTSKWVMFLITKTLARTRYKRYKLTYIARARGKVRDKYRQNKYR